MEAGSEVSIGTLLVSGIVKAKGFTAELYCFVDLRSLRDTRGVELETEFLVELASDTPELFREKVCSVVGEFGPEAEKLLVRGLSIGEAIICCSVLGELAGELTTLEPGEELFD